MSRLRWEAKASKRRLAEAALRFALERIENDRLSGGPSTYGGHGYKEALALVRDAEAMLRLSEAQ